MSIARELAIDDDKSFQPWQANQYESLASLYPTPRRHIFADGGDFLVGFVAFRFLPLSALPEVDYPTIQVQTFYPGASPDVMTSAVTAPLERQFGQMPGLNQMSSISCGGRIGC